MRANTRLNDDADIPFFRADWGELPSRHGRFDLIVGSDVLYEHYNLATLARFIQGHARTRCEIVIVDPGRKQQGPFSQHMLQYGFNLNRGKPRDVSYLAKPFAGSILTFHR